MLVVSVTNVAKCVNVTGQNVAADLAVQAATLNTDERKRARQYSTSVAVGLHEIVDGSVGVQKVRLQGETRLERATHADNEQRA